MTELSPTAIGHMVSPVVNIVYISIVLRRSLGQVGAPLLHQIWTAIHTNGPDRLGLRSNWNVILRTAIKHGLPPKLIALIASDCD